MLDKELKNDIIDDMVWSFSRLNSFGKCKAMWYITYIEKKEQRDNFFSQYGTFAHKIFEKYNKNELELFDIPEFICYNYDKEITIPAPPNRYVDLGEKYRTKLIDYFDSFNGFTDKTIGTEKEISFDIELCGKNRKFTGFIDRLSQDEEGNYIVTDYKSRGRFKNQEEIREYLRQPYLYSVQVKNEFGKYPKLLVFDLFKEGYIVSSEFTDEGLRESISWAEQTIKDIYDEEKFEPNYSDFFCNYICSCAEHCPIFTGKELM